MKKLTLARLGGLVVVALAASGLVWLRPSQASTGFTYRNQIDYKVVDDSTTDITQNYVVTNNTPGQYLTELIIATPATSLTDLRATYSSGQAIPATTATKSGTSGDLSYTYQAVTLRFPTPVLGQGNQWSFHLSYSAQGLVDSRGGSHTVYVPQIQTSSPGDSYTLRVEVPTSFGTPHLTGTPAASGGSAGGYQFFDFSQAQLAQKSLALAFGDASIYEINFNFPLRNDGALARDETVTLPPDLNNQQTTIESLNPKPFNTRLDADGNILADYHVAAHQHFTVTTKVAIAVKYLDYDLAASKTKAAIPAELVRQYTGSAQYWQTGGAVAKAAASVTKPDAPVIDNVRALYQFVIDKLTYNPAKIKFNVRQGAAAALANPTNVVCLEYADLLVALLRSQGIPARMPIGYAYSGGLKASPAVADSLHAWVEAYVPGIGWMTLDPTWGEKFDEFGQSDLDHVAFTVWGRSDQVPAAVMAGGQDLGYQYQNATIGYVPTVAAPASSGHITATRYIILPFLVFDRIDVVARPGAPSDGNRVKSDAATTNLGSLAPSQHTSVNRLAFRRDWLGASNAQLLGTSDGTAVVLAAAQFGHNFGPLVAIVLAAGLYLLGRFVIRLRTHSRPAVTPNETNDHARD